MDKTWTSGSNDLHSVSLPLKSATSEKTVVDEESTANTEVDPSSKSIPFPTPVPQTSGNKAEEVNKGAAIGHLNGAAYLGTAEDFCRNFCSHGDNEFVEKIGEGGMGALFKIRQVRLKRLSAMKVLQLKNREVGENDVNRFTREAQALAKLKTTDSGLRIPEVYESGEQGGFFYYLMQYIEGTSLTHRIGKKPIPVQEALPMVRELLQTLHGVHAAGIIHRDIKPDNILLDAQGHCWLIDFGLARPTAPSDVQVTAPGGGLLGTMPYMAPEHINGEPTAQSDLYSVGAVLHEMLTGQRAVPGQTASEVWTNVFGKNIRPPSAFNPKITKEIDLICRRAMQFKAQDRYASAVEFQKDIDGYRCASPRRRNPGIIAAAVLLLLLALTWSLADMLQPHGDPSLPTPGKGDKVKKTANISPVLPAQNGSSTVLPGKSSPPLAGEKPPQAKPALPSSPAAGATTEEPASVTPSAPGEPTSGEVSLTPPQFTVFRRRPGSAPWQEAVFLRSEDHYQIHLKVRQRCYIYGFQIDETGSIYQLFPDADPRIPKKHRYSFPLPVEAQDYVIAPQNGYFPLDKTPGFEGFCFLSSDYALDQPEKILGDYLAGRPLDPKISIVVKRLEQRDVSPGQNQ